MKATVTVESDDARRVASLLIMLHYWRRVHQSVNIDVSMSEDDDRAQIKQALAAETYEKYIS